MGLINIDELGGHVSDSTTFHLPHWFGHLPELPALNILGYEFQITKFMVIELAVAVLMVAFFVPLASKIKSGRPVHGRFWNLLESFLLYLRDEVIRPSIGSVRDANRFTPFLWTLFFFILFCNLFGLLPWMGSPTGSLAVTAVLAILTYLVVIVAGMKKFGLVGYWTGQVPKMEVPGVMAIFLKPMLFVIEISGLMIKHFVLAVRLLANMFAGHLVLAVFLAFIAGTAFNLVLWIPVTVVSVFMCVALDCLELFVAFLQAYIFMFLAALFIGMGLHQH